MTRLFRLVAIVAGGALMFSGCVPVYIPNTINAPLMRNAGQVHLGASVGTTGWDVQGAVAVTDAIAVMGNASFGSRSGSDSLTYNVHRYFEAAAGYYLPVSKASTFELFAGAGTGKSTSSDSWNDVPSGQFLATGWYNRYFLQMDYGAETNFLGGGFAMRTTYVHFTKIQDVDGNIRSNLDGYFAEPFLFASLGSPYVKFTGQMGFAWPLTRHIKFEWMPIVVNFGISVNINRH